MARFQASPDGAWLAVQAEGKARQGPQVWLASLRGDGARLLGGRLELAPAPWTSGGWLGVSTLDAGRRPGEVRWIDPGSGETRLVHGPREHPEEAGLELAPGMWGRVVEGRRGARLVEWGAREETHELPAGSDEVQLTAVPGLAFFSLRGAQRLQIHRLDLRDGGRAQVLPAATASMRWQVAPDGEAIATVDEQRTRVWSLEGVEIGGPWPSGEVRWAAGAGSRHLLLGQRGRWELLDLHADRHVDLGAAATPLEAEVLPDGRIVVSDGARVELRDPRGAPLRTLYPSSP